jgi:hypothetical protein
MADELTEAELVELVRECERVENLHYDYQPCCKISSTNVRRLVAEIRRLRADNERLMTLARGMKRDWTIRDISLGNFNE